MKCTGYTSCNAVVLGSTNGDQNYLCNMYENSDLGAPNEANEFWLALHDCPPGFTDFGVLGGCYNLATMKDTWQNVGNECNNFSPRSHLAGLFNVTQPFICLNFPIINLPSIYQ